MARRSAGHQVTTVGSLNEGVSVQFFASRCGINWMAHTPVGHDNWGYESRVLQTAMLSISRVPPIFAAARMRAASEMNSIGANVAASRIAT
jgi:hypothetical protein